MLGMLVNLSGIQYNNKNMKTITFDTDFSEEEITKLFTYLIATGVANNGDEPSATVLKYLKNSLVGMYNGMIDTADREALHKAVKDNMPNNLSKIVKDKIK